MRNKAHSIEVYFLSPNRDSFKKEDETLEGLALERGSNNMKKLLLAISTTTKKSRR